MLQEQLRVQQVRQLQVQERQRQEHLEQRERQRQAGLQQLEEHRRLREEPEGDWLALAHGSGGSSGGGGGGSGSGSGDAVSTFTGPQGPTFTGDGVASLLRGGGGRGGRDQSAERDARKYAEKAEWGAVPPSERAALHQLLDRRLHVRSSAMRAEFIGHLFQPCMTEIDLHI